MAIELKRLADIIEDEQEIIRKRRDRRYPKRKQSKDPDTNLVGLALSGGGIRSAVTNVGVLYEMSRVGLFSIVDYLSTVSGGGYIGCCISSLLSLKKPQSDPISGNTVYTYEKGDSDSSLFTTNWSSFPFRDLPVNSMTQDCQSKDTTGYGEDTPYCSKFTSRDQVFHLRDRASYLIPSSLPFGSYVIKAMGAVSATTIFSLSWFASLLVFITTLYMLFAFPELIIKDLKWDTGTFFPVIERSIIKNPESVDSINKEFSQTENKPSEKANAIDLKTDDGGTVKDIMKRASQAMSDIKIKLAAQANAFSKFGQSRVIVFLLGIFWGLLAPLCMHWRGRTIKVDKGASEDKESFLGRKQLKCISFITIALLFIVLLVCDFVVIKDKLSIPDARLLFPVIFSIGCLAGSLILLWILAGNPDKKMGDADSKKNMGISLYPSWNRVSRTELSLCSGIFLYCLAGSYIFAVLPAFILSGNAGFIALVQAGLILGLRYYLSGKKKNPGAYNDGKLTVFWAKISKWLLGLLVPLVVLLAVIGIAVFLGGLFFGKNWPQNIEPGNIICWVSVLTVAGFFSASLSLLNFNNISPHVFYKDRLAEAFLATFKRCSFQDEKSGNMQTRMDIARNSVEMLLIDLHGNEPQERTGNICAARGPYLLINATLNLTAARDLQGFRRQSESFLFSKCYTGSERTGYLATREYNPPLELGRAMTISGAALTSVMGSQGSMAESFACTILGVRLGYWLRNPIDMAKTLKKRTWNWKNLFYELIRYTDSRDSHIYLSDGGHCGDNLGLLPLLQRRTKLIIVSDAECDREHIFDSLNNSIRRAYVDYNIKIQISLDDLILNENGFTQKHYTIGRILYPDRPWQKSWLLVIKNTMTGKESTPILNYRKKSQVFPHETTADQFFSEEQFEVYRSLGREACMEIWRENIKIFRSEKWLKNPWSCIDQFCEALTEELHKWDDIIKAIWHAENGDFGTWQGFFNTIKKFKYLGNKDDSIMVKQLDELCIWLQDNEARFTWLQGKFDIPRTWIQFEEIRYHSIYDTPGNN
jgi:hypothetical protein